MPSRQANREYKMLSDPLYVLGKLLLVIRRLSTEEATVALLRAQTLNQVSPPRKNGQL
jgi:hypothetical protein